MSSSLLFYVKNPRRFAIAALRKVSFLFSDKTYVKIQYFLHFKKKLDLIDPRTFNEKIQWLKLYDRKNEYTQMVDKAAAKDYVKSVIGEEYLIPTIGVYNKFDDIDFNKLPEQFVLKCTHNSGGVVICKDKKKLNIEEAKKVISKSLKKDFYKQTREWPYKNVCHRIICEKYMVDESGLELKDYKFFCFNGKVKFLKIDFNRQIGHRANYYDVNFNLLEFGETVCPPCFDRHFEKPLNFEKMICLAERLSKNIPFVRVDLYNINGNVFFGEITFYPNSGWGTFVPYCYDEILGKMIKLPL